MGAVISPLPPPLPLCRANEMGVYYAVYNTVTDPVSIICCSCQVQAAHPHTPQCDDITAGYYLISINTQHSALCAAFPLSEAISLLSILSTDELGRTEQKEGEQHSRNPKQGPLLWGSSEEHCWKRHYLALLMQLWKTSGGWGNSFWFGIWVAWQLARG